MKESRIKISSILENQLPQFVLEEFPLALEFINQYYTSLDYPSGVNDILQNIDQYIKIDQLTNLIEYTYLKNDITFFDSTIEVDSTEGFPNSYGLLLIDSEIITYTSKTETSFLNCTRGFSGVTAYQNKKDELTFTESESDDHIALVNGTKTQVKNLSILFLKEFLFKVKKQIAPGFENKNLYSDLNDNLFLKQSIDFYSSKGTDNSFKILFKALYGENVEVIKPRDYIIKPSDAEYRVTLNLVVEPIVGDPKLLENLTLYQDKTDFLDQAQGTVTNVEQNIRDGKEYYNISLDYDYSKDIRFVGTVLGQFSVHPKTKTVSNISQNSNTIEVDSTVGFPDSGNLIVDFEDEISITISYASKTYNQFIDCIGISRDISENTEIKYDSYAYGTYNGEEIRVRIIALLSELNSSKISKSFFYSKGDNLRIKTLGLDLKGQKYNNWFFNIPTKYDVTSISLLDKSDRTYSITTQNSHAFKVGDSLKLISSSNVYDGIVVSYNGDKKFSAKFGFGSLLNEDLSYTAKKQISKVQTINYPEVNQYTSNVQNVYYDENDDSLYVSSPSLPSYLNEPLEINDQSFIIKGTRFFDGETLDIGSHKFYTGEAIFYRPSENGSLGISTGIYYVKKIDGTKIKLAKSKDNIFTSNFISVNGSVTDFKLKLANFVNLDYSERKLKPQKLIRKISIPENINEIYETKPGKTGVFINGVELLNYKSFDNVYYGKILNVTPISEGSEYDVINPPKLTITDAIGFGATGHCSVIGSLKKINVIDSGFDYVDDPIITIMGGNGKNAKAKANLIVFEHFSSFNSEAQAKQVKITPENIITFSGQHKFRNNEEVIYNTNGQTSVGGLSTNSSYFVSIQNEYEIKLHKSFEDSIVGINTLQLSSFGIGNHSFKSKNKKKKIGSISVEDGGENYENKLTVITSSGINTSSDTVTIKNHGYNSGEIIVYEATDVAIGGLSSSTSYYLTKIDEDSFKLSQIGISSLGITSSFYYETKQYINLTSTGSGYHKFNYPKIEVLISGKTGIGTSSNYNYTATLQPIFRGKIKSVYLESNGSNYGSEEILNYNRQPTFTLDSGHGANLQPVILNGQIVDVLIYNSGINYNSPPELLVNGSGSGAVLVPVLSEGSITDVKIVYGGNGYDQKNTSISVISSGYGAKFEAEIQKWKINLVEKLIRNSQITNDDGIITIGTPINGVSDLEYTHAYASRYLRSSVQGTKYRDGEILYTPDLQLSNNSELTSDSHSPIIGWAYDGNPIYGPYGYETKTGGNIKLLSSGYIEEKGENRPSESIYPIGFFVEDYVYAESGDLDEHNGRFCVTPEYPNGTYAYFSTISKNNISSKGNIFYNYKKPIFPYVIGNTFKSNPINFNFDLNTNQDKFDLNKTNLIRNTTPYNILNEIDSYEYFTNNGKRTFINSKVKNISSGKIDSIFIENGGENYKVGDRIILSSSNIEKPADAKVSFIGGKAINKISVATSSIDDVKLYPYKNEFVGFSSSPHNFSNGDLVRFTGNYDYNKDVKIAVSQNNLTLISGVGSASNTGIVTYFDVVGNLDYPNIAENDIYSIQNEQIKVLNIDKKSSRIRVLRNRNGTVGLTSYSADTILTEKTRKFKINFGISTTYNYSREVQYYFDPKESVGIGTSSGVGIVSTIYFSNPGAGITQIAIPTQSIYLRDHNINTGDSLFYTSNGGNTISVSTNGTSSFQLADNSIIYAAKISNDLIGISTYKVGINSVGTFIAIGSSNTGGLLYFTGIGTGNIHSFKTINTNSLFGQISKNVVTVSTAETHGLSALDRVVVKVNSGISTTVIVKYNDYNRRLIINPRYFSSIDIENHIITIDNHGYYTGQKILYNSNNPASGLQDNGIYYAIVVSSNTIKLSGTYYGATNYYPEVISINSSTPGTISAISGPLKFLKNQSIVFDLSDSSLSFTNNSEIYSAFDFKIYSDDEFNHEFNSSGLSNRFDVIKEGRIGIDSTAKITVTSNDSFPNKLYYNLVPINLNLNSQIKKDILNDRETPNLNSITFQQSEYSGSYNIVGVSSTSFNYNISKIPEVKEYNSGVEYYTNSKSAQGQIKNILISDGGKYLDLPHVSSIESQSGSDAILIPESESIGKILSIDVETGDFDYSSDKTIRPTVKLPEILYLTPLNSINYIKVISFGKNYTLPPNLILIDGLTNKPNNDVILQYDAKSSYVKIIKNSNYINSSIPKIIPINNSNGFKIKNISYNVSTKNVTITLNAIFNSVSEIPFTVGSKILVEGTSVGIGSTGKGYNSSNYNYALFKLNSVNPALTNATITYSLDSYLIDGEVPGSFDTSFSFGKVILEDDFPKFEINLMKNTFLKGEVIVSNSSSGTVVSWDQFNNILKVSTNKDFIINENIVGKTSNSIGIIQNIVKYDSTYEVNSSTVVRKNWNRNTGFLNDNFQRMHDNDYYQYFSYDLKSRKDIGAWNDPVSSLNHAAGFKKFGNLIVDSSSNSGLSTQQDNGDFTRFIDISSVVDLDCVHDFDLVRENNFEIDSELKSNEIYFNSRIIQDYIESVGNRVLLIDDISSQFNSSARSTKFSIVDTFQLSDIDFTKYIVLIQDKFFDYQQMNLVSLIHNGSTGFVNQYGLYGDINLGFFDFNVTGNLGNLLFYPSLYSFNDYHVSNFSFSLKKSLSGLTSINLGNSVIIDTNIQTIPSGTSSPISIVGIASTYRSSKILVQIGSTQTSYSECDEITYIHDGTDVYISNYGQLSTKNLISTSSSGIGTYNAYLSGSNVIIDLIPNQTTTFNYTVKTFNVSVANTSSIGVGTEIVGDSLVNSNVISIASTSTPEPVIIAKYLSSDYKTSYSIICIEDMTNLNYSVSEFITLSNKPNTIIDPSNQSYYVEYGTIQTNSQIGIITSGIVGNETIIYYTPNENTEISLKTFNVFVGIGDDPEEISIDNGSLDYNYGDYVGTENDTKKQFNLTHKNTPIFERYFNSDDSSIVDVQNNVIKVPNHFYSTGEEIVYSYPGYGTTQAIGIATTTISGIGSTDKLPSKLYVVKVDNLNVRVAASASEALKSTPNVLQITSVGIGSHSFTSKKQNNKTLISIDNVIQNPIISTSTTTHLTKNTSKVDIEIYVSNTKNIFGGDLLKINDEIVRVTGVGIASTNSIYVNRRLLGTGISSHFTNDQVTKIIGNYNIVNNTIYFPEAPYGKVPLLNPSNRPDEIDYTGISTGSSFNGRVFLRSGILDSNEETYSKNYIFDDISEQFNGITTSFTLKSQSANITGISSDNSILLINNILQEPKSNIRINDFKLQENSGITSVVFTGSQRTNDYDINVASIPRGGIIISVGSTQGFGYQPLVSAGGSAILSSQGSIQSISIGNSGSGYRLGIQTTVNVGIKTENLFGASIQNIGIASISNGNIVSVTVTNPGIGYTNYTLSKTSLINQNVSSGSTSIPLNDTANIEIGNYISVGAALTNAYIVGVGSTSILIGVGSTVNTSISSGTSAFIKIYNPPKIIFDAPLSYSNIPLIYSSQSPSGVGTGAIVDINVSLGSSVINFELKNLGFGYKKNEILTVAIGGTVGIPTNSSANFLEFQLTIDSVDHDRFSAWSIGEIQVIDPIQELFDGRRRVFPIKVDNNRITIKAKPGSNIDIKSVLLVFINDILQVPDEGYIFNGGSSIQFTEAPKDEDTCKILFYKGTGQIDTVTSDILETIKIGDSVRVKSDSAILNQKNRSVVEIISSDSLNTDLYSDTGISRDETLLRPIVWCKQRNDLIIDGNRVGKDRTINEPYIYPSTNIIENVGTSSTIIFVESVRPFFNSKKEYLENQSQPNKITIISQKTLVAAAGTANVSISGTVSSINILNGGVGYSTSPIVSISNPIGIGTSGIARATSFITGGIVSSVAISTGGFGYSANNPPLVLFEYPTIETEIIDNITYDGDFGIITGISTTSVGVASTGIVFDFYIPKDSILRDLSVVKVGIATTGISGIQTGYYFTIRNSNIGNGNTSLNSSGGIVGIGTTFIDNIYQAVSVSIAQTSVSGIGLTYVAKVTVSVSDYNNISGLGYSSYYGDYSWGAIFTPTRKNPKQFVKNIVGGSSTNPIVRRFNRLKYSNYNT